jgi:uncharacterized protein YciW
MAASKSAAAAKVYVTRVLYYITSTARQPVLGRTQLRKESVSKGAGERALDVLEYAVWLATRPRTGQRRCSNQVNAADNTRGY